MTAHPIDTEALARRAGHILFTDGPEQPAATARETCVLLDRLAAAEAERDEWRQTARDERGAALDALEQVKVRDARIKAVQDVLDSPHMDEYGDAVIHEDAIRRALNGYTET